MNETGEMHVSAGLTLTDTPRYGIYPQASAMASAGRRGEHRPPRSANLAGGI
jgi:hypothetical protein